MNIIFDFDGVILNSNKVKTNAFVKLGRSFEPLLSDKLVNYHIANGGVSRFKKIEWFVKKVLKKDDKTLVKKLVKDYGELVIKDFFKCQIRTNLFDLKDKLAGTKWFIASGGLETEIKDFLSTKCLINLFDGGVFGSPREKMKIVEDILKNEDFIRNSKWFMVGDSIYDFECASLNNINFIFAKDWSELTSYKEFINKNKLCCINGIEELTINLLRSFKN